MKTMRAMKNIRLGLAGAAAGVLLLAGSGPAHAVVEKSGSKYCASGEVVLLTAYGEGTIKFYSNGALRDTATSHYTVSYKTYHRSSHWRITSSGTLSNSTTASCVPHNIPPSPPE